MSKHRAKASTVALVFPGQGSQRVGMGLDLYQKYPQAREIFDLADETLNLPLSRLCFEGPEEELRRTINAQPAILTTSIACWKCLPEEGPLQRRFAFAAGHSLGEYSCLVAAEVMNFPDALRLVQQRGRLMEEAGQKQPGGMVAILGLEEEAVVEVCRLTGVEIANINCSGQIIISGPAPALEEAVALAKARGARRAVPLEVSGAFHSSLMNLARRGMTKVLRAIRLRKPHIPIVANTTALPLTRPWQVKMELEQQLCRCVQWQRSVEFMKERGVDTFVEVGPGQVLSGLIQHISPQSHTISLGTAAEMEGLAT